MTEAPAPSAPTDGARLSRRGVERLDLLMLTIEALDLNGGEAMVWTSQQTVSYTHLTLPTTPYV